MKKVPFTAEKQKKANSQGATMITSTRKDKKSETPQKDSSKTFKKEEKPSEQ